MNNGKNGKNGFNVDPKTVYTGTVLWFNDNRGYGFISTSELKMNDVDASIFAHYSRINTGEQFRTLSKGELVTFQITETLKINKETGREEVKLMGVNISEKKIIKAKAEIINQQHVTI